MVSDLIELKFKGQRRNIYENPQQFPFKVGDHAIVQADKGIDLGRVNHISSLLNKKKRDNEKLKKVIRKSNEDDMAQLEANHEEEKKALKLCKEKSKSHSPEMKLVGCEYQFDGKKITFYFTSENRVDFRKLVKDVAAIYKTRIEFRQIGVRDEARRLGGYGVCGRKLCCSSWIKDFTPITTQAAKDQNLSLNPSRLAGQGERPDRLLECLGRGRAHQRLYRLGRRTDLGRQRRHAAPCEALGHRRSGIARPGRENRRTRQRRFGRSHLDQWRELRRDEAERTAVRPLHGSAAQFQAGRFRG